MNSDLATIREHVEALKARGGVVDPDLTLRLLEALEGTHTELLLLRSIVSDLDEFFDSEEGPIMQPEHTCRPQRRLAQFYREQYKPNAAQRGHRHPGRTWGRGR